VSRLVSSRLFSGIVAGEQMKVFTTTSFHEPRFFLMPSLFADSATTRKTLIHGPIIYDAPCFGAPRISICGAPQNMRHIFGLIRGAPNVSCATHMWAPTGTNTGGGRPPYPWRIISPCSTHIICICGAPRFRVPLKHYYLSFGLLLCITVLLMYTCVFLLYTYVFMLYSQKK
jgi:hypothetical protein